MNGIGRFERSGFGGGVEGGLRRCGLDRRGDGNHRVEDNGVRDRNGRCDAGRNETGCCVGNFLPASNDPNPRIDRQLLVQCIAGRNKTSFSIGDGLVAIDVTPIGEWTVDS